MCICMEIPLCLYIIDRVQKPSWTPPHAEIWSTAMSTGIMAEKKESGGYRASFRAGQFSLMQSESAVLSA